MVFNSYFVRTFTVALLANLVSSFVNCTSWHTLPCILRLHRASKVSAAMELLKSVLYFLTAENTRSQHALLCGMRRAHFATWARSGFFGRPVASSLIRPMSSHCRSALSSWSTLVDISSTWSLRNCSSRASMVHRCLRTENLSVKYFTDVNDIDDNRAGSKTSACCCSTSVIGSLVSRYFAAVL